MVRSLRLKFRSLPLRTRWLITIVGYALVIGAIAVVVRSGTGGSTGGATGASPAEAAAAAQANRVGRIAIAEDEAPHSAKLARGLAPQAGLERAVAADVRERIAHGQLTGPLQSVRCEVAPGAHAGRRQLTCTVQSAGLSYPFVGVADERARELTWCKVDPAPVANAPLEVPVSPRCRA
jgi:hypothetical protein